MTQEEKNFEIINLHYGKASTHTFFKPEKCLYSYNGSKKSGTVYYCCIEEHCACRGKIILDVFSRTNPEVDHNHENHEKKAECERSYYQLKEIVSNERRAVRDIHQEFLRTMSFETSGKLAWGHVRHTLLRIRRQKMPACPDLQTFINHLECNDDIYESYGMIRDLPFYLGTVKNTMMIFGNQRMVAELEPFCSLFIDATYGITPFNAHQLLVVLAEIKEKPRPIAYAIMTSRREADYVAVFKHLRNSLFSYDGNIRVPVNAMCDYEKAMRNALPKVWPDINVRGCFFHFTQAIRRKAMKFQELSTKLNGDTIHHNTLLMFSRLCLLPIDRIDIGLEALVEYISSNRILERDFRNFIDYFDRTWMIRYDKSDWCISDSVRRSNNHVEGHNRFIKQIIDRNPPAWIFIEGLLDISYDALATLAADEGNNSQIDRSRISNPLARFLAELEEDNITELEFLQQLARITHSS